MTEPRLCYVDGNFAYFTPRPLSEQTGDDWNGRPYEHNAGEPYGDDITIVAFRADVRTPDWRFSNSPYSVDDINAPEGPPWLESWDGTLSIRAGATVSEFIAAIRWHGGEVYTRDN